MNVFTTIFIVAFMELASASVKIRSADYGSTIPAESKEEEYAINNVLLVDLMMMRTETAINFNSKANNTIFSPINEKQKNNFNLTFSKEVLGNEKIINLKKSFESISGCSGTHSAESLVSNQFFNEMMGEMKADDGRIRQYFLGVIKFFNKHKLKAIGYAEMYCFSPSNKVPNKYSADAIIKIIFGQKKDGTSVIFDSYGIDHPGEQDSKLHY